MKVGGGSASCHLYKMFLVRGVMIFGPWFKVYILKKRAILSLVSCVYINYIISVCCVNTNIGLQAAQLR